MHRTVALVVALLAMSHPAAAQTQDPVGVALPDESDSRRFTLRLHAGPNLNLMKDWRNGLDMLQTRAQQRGLPITGESCICMSWGSTALVHVTSRLAFGAGFEMLRDTRSFTVEDEIGFIIPGSGSFGFRSEAVDRTTQAVAAFYPRADSRTHVQVGIGRGSAQSRFSSPGGDAEGTGSGVLVSAAAGMESGIWYVDAGWRLHRLDIEYDTIRDQPVDRARDLFASEAEVRQFVERRQADFTGGWVRIGLVFRFGRRYEPRAWSASSAEKPA
jgi:hypothetical protein